MVLEEDSSINRMQDDIKLFGELICTRYLPKLWMFFQNKSDLFASKLKKSKLSNFFPDADKTREEDFEYGVEFIRSKFLVKAQQTDVRINWHVTCALDSEKFSKIFKDNELIEFLSFSLSEEVESRKC
eukprot:TRINITY_DN5886_c0_g1_i3.p2 TRINITY_DN5886_c0_g1~~TRINITY_DN5886_c0_g1_i3.p2  ORF type:complete len:128 (-),score=22.71 TRINITY_DN5886_c0_g1_i3:176-559(-)